VQVKRTSCLIESVTEGEIDAS